MSIHINKIRYWYLQATSLMHNNQVFYVFFCESTMQCTAEETFGVIQYALMLDTRLN